MRTMSGMPVVDLPRSPAAIRLRRPGWRDPRLAGGLVLVAVATLAGARLLTDAAPTTTVWATAEPVLAGQAVEQVRLVPSSVQLPDGAAQSAYLSASDEPAGVFTHELAAGELVPVEALAEQADADRVDLPLAVDAGAVPVDLATGQLVDVWSVPDPATPGSPAVRADRVLRAVPVAAVRSGSALGGSTRQVVVTLDHGAGRLAEVFETLAAGAVALVRVDAR